MADLSKIAAQEIGEMALRHFQELNARLDREQELANAVIERTQWLRMLTLGEMRLEYVQILEDGQLRYNDPAGQVIVESPVEPPPIETCVQPPETLPDLQEGDLIPEPEPSNGQKSTGELAGAG